MEPFGIAVCGTVAAARDGGRLGKGALPQTKQLFTRHSWAAAALRRDATSGMLVFSDTVHEDWENGVLCKVHKAPADVMRPLLVGGGRCKAVVGPFVVMNRPLLSLFANESLLQRCRESYLRTNATASDESFVYAGAAYNNDHLISYCAFSFFPRTWSSYRPYNPLLARLSVSPKFAYSMSGPSSSTTTRRVRGGRAGAASAGRTLADPRQARRAEPVVAFHHATPADRAYFDNGT
ncbi:hypothetical protein JL722_9247 [Aureococcus anophagefferens]|nr:hypothetical protein JL722_9247 [Aureococcus anophagefferens]